MLSGLSGVYQLHQAFFQINGGDVPEEAPGFGNVGQRVLDVAGARGSEGARHFVPSDRFKRIEQFKETRRLTRRDVEDVETPRFFGAR